MNIATLKLGRSGSNDIPTTAIVFTCARKLSIASRVGFSKVRACLVEKWMWRAWMQVDAKSS
jgi:hypothetical protein